MHRFAIATVLVLAQSACSPRPEVEELLGPEPVGDTYPSLLPLRQFPVPSTAPLEEGAAANAALEARAEALRRRAARPPQ